MMCILHLLKNMTLTENVPKGISSENAILSAAPASPNRNPRMKIPTQVRTSSTPAPRSVPVTSVQQSMAPQEAWNNAYSPVSTIERSPSIADASPVAGNMRWNSHHSPVGPPIPEPERHNMQPMDPALQQQQQYAANHNYVVDTNGRPMQHHQQYQPEPQMMAPYAQTRSPTGHVPEYHPGHSNAQMVPSPATAYPTYPHSQGYIPASPHEPEQMHMMQQRPGMEAQQQPQQQQIMYSMHSNSMKHEH